jgi:hypothetical protein
LEISVSALVENPAQQSARILVSRASERSVIVDPRCGAKRDTYRTALPASKVELVRYVVPPRTKAGPFAATGRND